MEYAKRYFSEVKKIADSIDVEQTEKMIKIILELKKSCGRLFFLGVGGSAANCSHAVNDFRKVGSIEAYSPTDNVAEITARTNDEGWETVFVEYLRTSQLTSKDAIFVFSVGGGDKEKNVSANLVYAMEFAKQKGAKIMGIVGRDGGYCGKNADAVVVIPSQSPDTVTPHAEAWQAVVWHMLVSDPRIQQKSNKWESLDKS